MNLTPLFDRQRALAAHILAAHPKLHGVDLLPKKILALQVEIGEHMWQIERLTSTSC